MLALLGPARGHLRGYVDQSFELCRASLGLCGPSSRAMLGHLRQLPRLLNLVWGHVGRSSSTRSEKWEPQNIVNCGRFVPTEVSRRKGLGPLSPLPTAMPQPRVWAPGAIFELTLIVGSAGLLDPPFHRSVGLKAIE